MRILYLEDSPRDAEIIRNKLVAGGLGGDVLRVETEAQFQAALAGEVFDLILCDYNLPDYDGLAALTCALAQQPATPVLLISGTLGEEQAVQCLQLGATDYLLKDRLDRLPAAVRRALAEAENHRQRQHAEQALAASERRLRTIFETEPECVELLGPNGTLLEMNPAGLRMIEADSLDQVRGRSVLEGVLPAYRAAYADLCERVLRGESGTLEFEIQALKGTRRWLETRAVPLRDEAGQGLVLGITRDITEYKQAGAALRASEARYRTLFDYAPDGIAILNPEGYYLDANASACRMLGYARAELLRLHASAIAAPAETQHVGPALSAVNGKSDHHREWQLRRKDGSVFPVEAIATLMPDGNVLGVMRDITERKQFEGTLHASEAKYRTLIERMGEGLIQVDDDDIIRFVNPQICRMLGYSEAELLGQHAGRLLNREEDQPSMVERNRQRMQGLSEGYELQLRKKSGEFLCVRNSATPVTTADGQPSGSMAIITDITERKQSEAQLKDSERLYHSLVETLPQNLFRKDLAGRFTFANRTCCQWLGRELDQVVGRTDFDFFPAAQATAYRADDQRVIQSGAVLSQVEEQQTPDGKTRFVQVVKAPLRDAQGTVSGVQGIFWDVSQERRLEAQLRESQKMEAIGQLAGGIAHDFNNILAAILGNTELIQMGPPLDPATTACLDSIKAASQRAADLVRQILAFSRRQDQARLPIQLQVVVREAVKLLRATVPATIEFRPNLAKTRTVLADASQIHQVVMNLCTNAAHAMNGHSGVLTVELAETEVDDDFAQAHADLRRGAYVRLRVADNGCGMSPATLARIFEPFFTTKALGEGTGLGLSVVHGIIKSHDGGLTVHSQPGAGTRFDLYFPVFEAEVPEAADGVEPLPIGHGERILFVDDEESLAELGENILKRLGYRVTVRSKVMDALALFREQPDAFDLVITDLNMPVMNGTTFAWKLLELRPELKIILTTGYSATLTPEAAQELGFRALLPKPSDLRALGEIVQRVLQNAGAPGQTL